MIDEFIKIAITTGDPTGVGPEVVIKSMLQFDLQQNIRFLIIGDSRYIKIINKHFIKGIKLEIYKDFNQIRWQATEVSLLDVPGMINYDIEPGTPDPENAQGVINYIDRAVNLALEKKVHAIVTGPIDKSSLQFYLQKSLLQNKETEIVRGVLHLLEYKLQCRRLQK